MLDVDYELGDVKVSFLNSPGSHHKSRGSFNFPFSRDIGVVPSQSVISYVDPTMTGRSGRGCRLSQEEINLANKALLKLVK